MNYAKELSDGALAVDISNARTSLAISSPRRDAMREPGPLTSWKEISRYLGYGVRTLQRYEVKLGLPIHRPAGTQPSSVLAFPDELDFWMRSTPLRKSVRVRSKAESKCGPLCTTKNDFRSDLQRAEADLKSAVQEYQRCLERYHRLKNSIDGDSGSSRIELLACAG